MYDDDFIDSRFSGLLIEVVLRIKNMDVQVLLLQQLRLCCFVIVEVYVEVEVIKLKLDC